MGFWRREFTEEEIAFVLKRVRAIRIFSESGTVALKGGGDADKWISFLVAALGVEIKTDALRNRVVRDALFSASLEPDFSEKDFRRIVYGLRDKFENQSLKPYKVVFPLWGCPPFLKGRKTVDGVSLNFSPSTKTSLYRSIAREREDQRSHHDFKFFFTTNVLSDLMKCSTCVAHVRANSPADANQQASEAIYEILGILNIAKDSGKSWRFSSRIGGKLPVSEVLIAPHTTTHSEDGTLTHDGFWHESWVGGPTKNHLTSQRLVGWERDFNRLRKSVSTSLWRPKCKSAAARYFKAFSNPNLEEAFLDGWRLFENITGARYEKIETKITRASNIFADNIEHRIIGKHLALRRNLISHGHPIRTEDEESLAFQMLQFVLPYLERFILNGFSFASTDEFWEFLDLPSSQEKRISKGEELKRQLSLLEKAARFRGEATSS